MAARCTDSPGRTFLNRYHSCDDDDDDDDDMTAVTINMYGDMHGGTIFRLGGTSVATIYDATAVNSVWQTIHLFGQSNYL